MSVDIRVILPWMALAGAMIGIVTYISTRDNRIAEAASTATQTTIAISSLKSDINELSATFKQSMDALKSQEWMEHGRTEGRLDKLDGKYSALEEEIDTDRLKTLEKENALLRAMIAK